MTVSNKTSWKLAAMSIVSLAIGSSAAMAGPLALIDSFDDTNLSEYTQTLVLDQNATSNISFISPAGQLQVTKTAGTEAEQVLFLRDDFTLAVDEILRVDLSYTATMRADIGIAVAATATPTPLIYNAGLGGTQETRRDYAAVYVQADANNLKGIYIDGTTPGPTIFAGGFGTLANGDVLGLYIRRDSLNDFALGYSTAAGDTDFATQSLANTAIGNAIGIFGDVRSVSTFGGLDNLRVENPNATLVSVEIDSATGQGKLINHQNINLEFDVYEITSEFGGLNTGWSGIDGATTPGTGWDPAGGSDEFHLMELYLPEGGWQLPALGELPLGQVYVPSSGTTGFTMSMSLANGSFLTGPVDFVTSTGPPGDYNGDNTVNAADYTVWRNHLGETFQLTNENPSDANPGVVDQNDYAFWKSQFGMTLGGGGALANATVPEPASALIMLVGTVTAWLYRRSG